jgi:predicted phosphodiesterase
MANSFLKLAVFTDLHIGATTANHWHNRFLTDRPEETAAATVAAVNRERPDVVIVTGDLSDTATDGELRLAREVLDGLDAPYIVCRGNHDQPPGGGRASWQRHFGERAPAGIVEPATLPLPEGVVALILDADWGTVDGQWRVFIPDAQARQAISELAALRPRVLLACCHFPLARQSDFIRSRDPEGKNAGTLWEGEQLLAALAREAGAALFFTGHQHFHHIATGPGWLHCTTASLAEYPAEYRVITLGALGALGDAGISIRTACGAPELVAANPPRVDWVRGRAEDREFVWTGA